MSGRILGRIANEHVTKLKKAETQDRQREARRVEPSRVIKRLNAASSVEDYDALHFTQIAIHKQVAMEKRTEVMY